MLLEVDDIHSFYGSSHVLHGVSIHVDEGEVVALLGRNGVGKSTTLRSIIGIVEPRRGHVRIRGDEVTGWPSHRIARLGIGYVPEERRIFSDLTVEENLRMGTFGSRARGERTWTTEAVIDLFPNLGERMGNLGRQLSGGEQQMLAIARGLMSQPDVLLLDEPSEGLAPVIVQRMQEAMSRLKEEHGITVLLAEQSLEFVKGLAKRGYVMDKGTISYEGPINELLDDPELAQKYLAI